MPQTKADQPPAAQTYTRPNPTNGMSITSFVLSLCGVTFVLPVIGNILGVIFGFIARSQIKKSGEEGSGLALAGILIGGIPLILGFIALIVFLILLALGIFAASDSIQTI